MEGLHQVQNVIEMVLGEIDMKRIGVIEQMLECFCVLRDFCLIIFECRFPPIIFCECTLENV